MKTGNACSKQFIFGTLIAATIMAVGLISSQVIAEVAEQSAIQPAPIQANYSDTGSHLFSSGTLSTGGYYDTTLGAFADGKLSAYLGGSDQHAVALEFVGGANQYRVNTTYGFALTDNQRIKLTYDYLTQYHNFKFDLGDTNRWVKQHAVGGAYAYLFDNPYVESIEVGGYYSTSPSQGLSTQTETTDTTIKTNERRIAGATSWHAYTDLALRLWPHSRLIGGMDYDYVNFDTQNSNTKTVNGVGGHVQVEQRVLPQVKVTGMARFQQQQREYLGSVGWLLPSLHGMQLELAAVTDYIDSIATKRHFFINGARLSVALGTSNGRYAELDDNGKQSLLAWVRTPAVRMNDVLAIADGKSQFLDIDPQYESKTLIPEANRIRCSANKDGDGNVTSITCISDDGLWKGTVTEVDYEGLDALVDEETGEVLVNLKFIEAIYIPDGTEHLLMAKYKDPGTLFEATLTSNSNSYLQVIDVDKESDSSLWTPTDEVDGHLSCSFGENITVDQCQFLVPAGS